MSSQRGINRRRLLQAGGAAGLGAAALAGCGGSSRREPAGERRNVVVIVTDTTRADHLGAYGDRRGLTPNLDALARDSLLFERAHAEGMPTVPARRALLTGRRSFPFRNWRLTELLPPVPGWMSIPESQEPWAALLGREGVTTAYVTDNPFLIGPRFTRVRESFDHFEAFVGQAAYYSGREPRSVPGDEIEALLPESLHDSRQRESLGEYLYYNPRDQPEDENLTARVFGSAIDLLGTLASQEPFALVVDAFDPHEPWDPPRRWAERFAGDPSPGLEPIQPFQTPVGVVRDIGLTDAQVERARGLYAAEMAFVDHWIGNLVGDLDRRKLLDRTTIVYVSDHGILLGERGWIGKVGSQLHREVSHVPLLVRDPEGREAGTRSAYFASTHDVAPTLLGALGVPVPGLMEGEDLGLLLAGRELAPRPHATAAYDAWVMCRDDRWLLIGAEEDDRRRLYDTRADPRETRDVAAENPGVVERLWAAVLADAGGTLPRFTDDGVAGGG